MQSQTRQSVLLSQVLCSNDKQTTVPAFFRLEVRLIKIETNLLFHLCFRLKILTGRMLLVVVVGWDLVIFVL